MTVTADEPNLLAGVAAVYGSLADSGTTRTVAAHLRSVSGNTAVLEVEGESFFGVGDDLRGAGAGASFGLYHPLARAATDHLVLHAAAVELGGRVVVIVAPSGVGKTTLTLGLVLRGAGFLSDESAPIERATGCVLPMPRAVGVRPGPLQRETLRRAGSHAVAIVERGGRRKYVVDLIVAAIAKPASGGAPAHIVMLQPPGAGEDDAGGACRWQLDIDRPSPQLCARLVRVPGVRAARPIGPESEPAVSLLVEDGARVSEAVDVAARAVGVRVVRFVDQRSAAMDYTGEPTVRELTAVAGLRKVARHLEGGHGADILRHIYDGSPSALFEDLARTLGACRFWSLEVGDLSQMCSLVQDLP